MAKYGNRRSARITPARRTPVGKAAPAGRAFGTGSFGKTRRNRRLVALCIPCALAAILGLAAVLGIKSYLQPAGNQNTAAASDASPAGKGDQPEAEGKAGEKAEAEKRAAQGKPVLVAAESCDALDIVVDPRHPLPPDYAPDDLVYLGGYGVALAGGDLPLRREAAAHLGRLSRAAAVAGQEVLVASAYRSYTEQQGTFAHFTGIYGGWADHVSAPPGESQHQLGTTVDFTNSEVGYGLIPTFVNTSASRWLAENAWKHGYVNTYPPEDTTGTGRQAEPWEYRYVGPERARKVQASDLSLRRFLYKHGQAPCG